MKNNNEIQIQFVPIELLEYNEGQIPGVPENPRTREDAKQRNLEKRLHVRRYVFRIMVVTSLLVVTDD